MGNSPAFSSRKFVLNNPTSHERGYFGSQALLSDRKSSKSGTFSSNNTQELHNYENVAPVIDQDPYDGHAQTLKIQDVNLDAL